MAPAYSDRRIVERARDMTDMHAGEAAMELGIGYRRLRRLMDEYGLKFSATTRVMRPVTAIKTNQDAINHFMVAKIDGVKHKKCTQCREIKKIERFHRDKSKSTGVASACKSCVSSRKDRILDGDT